MENEVATCAKCGKKEELCNSVRIGGIKQPRYCMDCVRTIMRTGDESHNDIFWLLQMHELNDTETIERRWIAEKKQSTWQQYHQKGGEKMEEKDLIEESLDIIERVIALYGFTDARNHVRNHLMVLYRTGRVDALSEYFSEQCKHKEKL